MDVGLSDLIFLMIMPHSPNYNYKTKKLQRFVLEWTRARAWKHEILGINTSSCRTAGRKEGWVTNRFYLQMPLKISWSYFMVCFYGFYASIKAKELKVLTKNHKNIDFSGNYWVSYKSIIIFVFMLIMLSIKLFTIY